MSTSPAHPATAHPPSSAEDLLTDLRAGSWHPTPLEVRVAGMLVTSVAGDSLLNSVRIRAALWEGAVTMLHDNGGRFARTLADLVPVLDDPQLTDTGVPETAGELVAAVAAAAS